MTNPKIIFPIFESCVSLTTDPYWKEVFGNLSVGRFPPELRYDPNHHNIILRVEKKPEVIAIPDHSVTETFKILMMVLKSRVGMKSTRDLKLQKEEMTDLATTRSSTLDCGWKKLHPRSIKEHLIMKYLTKLEKKYSLTPAEKKNLVSLVQLGIQFRSIPPDNIVYERRKVRDIKGLEFDEHNRTFSVPKEKPASLTCEKTPTQNRVYTGLDKFLKEDKARLAKLS